MPRATWVQTNFNGGEWSPLASGRVDAPKYKGALATCLNYIPTSQGGLTRRPGTYYVANTKSNATVRLVPFEFSITQAYILEFGDFYVRFYTNDAQLLSGGSPYEVATPYAIADVWDLAFTQSADVLYIAHPNYAPRKLMRAGALSWSIATISFLDGPYLLVNTTATTLTSSVGTGSATVTASSVTGINGGSGFLASDVGRVIRLKSGTTWGWGTITARASTTSITVSWSSAVGTTATTTWRLGVWCSTNGYPRALCFNQDRLVFAGPTQYPNRIDASNTGDYENFAPSGTDGVVVDSNALAFSLNAQQVNVINWLVSDEWGLLAGTPTGEWVVAASTQQNAITPTNITAKQTSAYGSTAVPPVRVGKATLFIQRTKRKLREMAYQFTIGTFQAPDISMLGEHLTKSGIKQMALTAAPHPIVWLLRNDGTLVGMTYDREMEIIAWHQHSVGGYSDSGQTVAPVVESIAAIPDPTTTRDELWLSVQRYINGGTVRTVERLSKFWEDGDAIADGFFVDCGYTYSGVAANVITGLTWLKGQTVSVLTDGAVHRDVVVDSSGQIALDYSTTKAQIGLKYNSDGRTLRIEAGGGDGPAQGKFKRIHRVIVRFFQSVGLQVAPTNSSTPYPENFRSSADPMTAPVSLYTGDKRWAWDGSYETEGQVFWRQSDPLPSNILMLAVQLETQDGG